MGISLSSILMPKCCRSIQGYFLQVCATYGLMQIGCHRAVKFAQVQNRTFRICRGGSGGIASERQRQQIFLGVLDEPNLRVLASNPS